MKKIGSTIFFLGAFFSQTVCADVNLAFGPEVWDIVSFPVTKPEQYQPLMAPDYVFQEWP